MANPEHVKLLKRGVKAWNKWRRDNPEIKPDLIGVTLKNRKLRRADFRIANLSQADLSGADLIQADLSGANLFGADLSSANLLMANVSSEDRHRAVHSSNNFRGATLISTSFFSADLSGRDLREANLSGANLRNADLSQADLSSANLEEVICGKTIFANVNLSSVHNLNSVKHEFPSSLGLDTIFRSKGKIPEIFLRGCGVSEMLITFLPSMMEDAIQFYSCFISYSHADKAFAQRFHDRLQGKGIRCWLDEHQLNPGDELHKTIYEGIRVYDKVIMCCSETALKSWWVEKEFKNAISKEEDYAETVLIPITLDDYLFNQSADDWTIGEIKRRFVQDFSDWKDHDAFEAAFEKVVKALRTDGGKPPPPESKLTRREKR